MENIYQDIAARTGGNIYIGVAGPVRTGKSTLIKRIMEALVIPNIEDPYRAERARDELPQSGSGKTIMTSEPKFVPEEAVEISPDGTARLSIRMIDSVGYMVAGAVGAEEDGEPRMVTTPWYDHEIPMTQAAELGTQKVMQEHCTVGLVVTTDGTVTDIPRQDYVEAERRAITDMKATGKPFLVILNSCQAESAQAKQLQQSLENEFGVRVMLTDCQALDADGIRQMLKELLYTFPMQELRVHWPRWMDALECTHPVKATLHSALTDAMAHIDTLSQAESAISGIGRLESVNACSISAVDLAQGAVSITVVLPQALFYEILSARAGTPIESDAALVSLLSELSTIRDEYRRIESALNAAKATGYGIVMPDASQMQLDPPQLLRRNGSYGVMLKAGAPSIHMIRVDVDTQIKPMVGDEKQSQDLVDYLSTESPEKLWESNIFGKSVYALVQEGLNAKLLRTGDDVRMKFRDTLTRVVNEGANGLLCLIL